jgi:hypothetical protein
MKILMGYIFGVVFIVLGMYLFNLSIECVKNKEWAGAALYFPMGTVSFLIGVLDVLHMKGWI